MEQTIIKFYCSIVQLLHCSRNFSRRRKISCAQQDLNLQPTLPPSNFRFWFETRRKSFCEGGVLKRTTEEQNEIVEATSQTAKEVQRGNEAFKDHLAASNAVSSQKLKFVKMRPERVSLDLSSRSLS